MLRIVLALVIAAHGIGHILFLVPLLGIADWGQSTRSWLLVDHTAARFVGSLLWIAVIVAFGAGEFDPSSPEDTTTQQLATVPVSVFTLDLESGELTQVGEGINRFTPKA